MTNAEEVINDVTGLNPVRVRSVLTPRSVEDVRAAIRDSAGPISIGGGRFSMGGQIASAGSLHLDMRELNKIIDFSPEDRIIRVEAGIRWSDIQNEVDAHDLSIKIMQTYANFTVGGSLSVNVHGRYMGLGPLILSVRKLSVVTASGDLVEATPEENAELFFGVIGGYGGLGVIVEAELDLAENCRVERIAVKLPTREYLEYFKAKIRKSESAVFHNADLYPPQFTHACSVTWIQTTRPATKSQRLMPARSSYPLQKYFFWAFTETPFGKWRRQHIIDPLIYFRSEVHWRNYEAGYDVQELKPGSREESTYVLQEYFVPIDQFDNFVLKLAEILQRHGVNVVNISVRHAIEDPGSLLAWARQEVFAFVLYYKQRVDDSAKNHVAIWTRELIEAAIALGGAYYLPYQVHATADQFHRAYPRARELFELKQKFDPDFRLRNAVWNAYYPPSQALDTNRSEPSSEFHDVFSNTGWHDAFFRFLQVIFRVYPEDKFHQLIKDACAKHESDAAIYRSLQENLPTIKPFLSELSHALPALKTQKREMVEQTLQLLDGKTSLNGYLEIGSTGRYISDLRKHLTIGEPVVLVNDIAPDNSPIDIVERGQLRKIGRFVGLNDYQPIGTADVDDNSMDLVTCYIGLHHIQPEKLEDFIKSIWRILRPGGLFILRDHDVNSSEMDRFVSLVHTVFNAGTGVDWDVNRVERRHFKSVDDWCRLLQTLGFENTGAHLLQANDPSDNTLMSFTKLSEISTNGTPGETTPVTSIRPGKPYDFVEATSLIYESSHELFDFMLGNRVIAERVIGKLYQKNRGHFSHQFSTVALLNGRVVGIELGYDKTQLAQQELVGGVMLFLNSPIARWWHILNTVNGIVESYVLKPSEDAYYINNIAVSPECRGTGIGKLLLLDTLERAKQKGFDCVELDVTSVNEHAINFYKKAGFATVSESGSEALHIEHGLPFLVRMRWES